MIRSAVLLAVVYSVLSTQHSPAADWPVFRGDARMTGISASKLPDKLDERWAFKCKEAVESAPAIADGVVYVASADKHLYALDLATGKEKWKALLGPMKSAPAVHKGRVYVGDLDGKFHAVEAATGKKLWTFETFGEIHAGANFFKDDILIGSHDSTLYRLTPDGKKVWEFKIDGPVNGSAAIAGDRTFLAGCDSILHVVDLNSGKSVGGVELGGQAAATAAVGDDLVVVGTMTNQVAGIDWKNLKKVWEFEPKRRSQPFYASAALTEKLVVTGSRDKKVYALDRATGQERWSFITEGMVDGSPVVVGNKVYAGCLSSTGEFYVLDLASGKQVQQIILDGAVTGSPAVGPDCIVIGTERGTVYCLGKK
jgi:outer membrane protein assembly factor BamB